MITLRAKWGGIFAAVLVLSSISTMGQETQAQPAVTFYRDVLPVLQQHCQECHREGEIAPFR